MSKFVLKGEEYPFDEGSLRNTEAIILEKQTGERMRDILESWGSGGALGITCMVWIAMRRNGRPVKFEDLEFDFADIEFIRDEPVVQAEDPTQASPQTPPPTRSRSPRSKTK
jgi:hypothetical protein